MEKPWSERDVGTGSIQRDAFGGLGFSFCFWCFLMLEGSIFLYFLLFCFSFPCIFNHLLGRATITIHKEL